MKKLFLSAALFSATALFAAAETPASAENKPSTDLEIDTFLEASRNMQSAINKADPVFEKLELDADDLEIMMPDEQFQAICDAITRRYAGVKTEEANADKFADAKVIFGEEYAKEIQPFIGNQPAIENVRRQLRGAYEVFAGYHSTQELASSVVDWNWGDSWGVTINPSVGTLGVGIDAGYEFNRFIKIRAHWGTGQLDTNINLSDTDIDVAWENHNNIGVFVDYHPKGSQFHVTAGLMRMDPRIRAEANYHGKTMGYDAQGQGAQYDVYSTYRMDGEWENEIQPYIGIGWSSDGSKKRTLYFSVDIGLAYLGEGNYAESGAPHFYKNGQPFKDPTTTGDFSNLGEVDAVVTLKQFDNNVRDAVEKIADFLNDMYVYPVIQIGGGIRF